jgi:glucose/arabinose dehydrogenase
MRDTRLLCRLGLVLLGAGASVAFACGSTNSGGAGATTSPVSDASVDATTGTNGQTDSGSGSTVVTESDGAVVESFDSGTNAGVASEAPAPRCNGSVPSSLPAGSTPPSPPTLTVTAGFKLETIAKVGAARELVALPNGDLLVATSGGAVSIVPNADGEGLAGAPTTFAAFSDTPAQGIAFAPAICTIYVSTQHAIYSLPYVDAQQSATPGAAIASVRTGIVAPNSDGDIHTTTSVAVANGLLYAGVGSSCNACIESDPTRATVQVMKLDGTAMTTRATRFRNAIALTENPRTGALWAGGAGQDQLLPAGHPYELFDAVTSHAGVADYGWPACEENQHAYIDGSDCSSAVEPLVELPAYSTIIGATFYPASPTGAHAFPAAYRGGVFLTAHGSWHMQPDGTYFTPPRVAFVAMNGDAPKIAVNWSDPSVQWTEVIGGFQTADGKSRIARPTGIAVGPSGSLFVSDDQNGLVYRIRPI